MDDMPVDDKPYPETWEKVAELRVFRSTQGEWAKLISWRGDMKKKGWKLLKVTTETDSMVAVFGRTREELAARSG